MHSFATKFCFYVIFSFISLFNAAHADMLPSQSVSSGLDGALFVDSAVNMAINEDTVFNFTSIEITPRGILTLIGTEPGITFTMLATQDISIGGILNIYANLILQNSGRISVGGEVSILQEGFLRISADEIIIDGNIAFIEIQPVNSVVPEPSLYGLFLVGGLFLYANRRRLQSSQSKTKCMWFL